MPAKIQLDSLSFFFFVVFCFVSVGLFLLDEIINYSFKLKVNSRWPVVVLRLNVPVNNFSVMSGRSHRFLGN